MKGKEEQTSEQDVNIGDMPILIDSTSLIERLKVSLEFASGLGISNLRGWLIKVINFFANGNIQTASTSDFAEQFILIKLSQLLKVAHTNEENHQKYLNGILSEVLGKITSFVLSLSMENEHSPYLEFMFSLYQAIESGDIKLSKVQKEVVSKLTDDNTYETLIANPEKEITNLLNKQCKPTNEIIFFGKKQKNLSEKLWLFKDNNNVELSKTPHENKTLTLRKLTFTKTNDDNPFKSPILTSKETKKVSARISKCIDYLTSETSGACCLFMDELHDAINTGKKLSEEQKLILNKLKDDDFYNSLVNSKQPELDLIILIEGKDFSWESDLLENNLQF